MKKILVPLDGSATAEAVLPAVRKLVEDNPNLQVMLLAVPWVVPPPHRVDYPLGEMAQIEFERKRSAEYIERIAALLRAHGLQCSTSVIDGLPAQVIAQTARNEGADLIVMATHGQTGWRRAVFGSVAAQVLQDAHVPVVMVRPEPA
jgi:nucleotide-binding universal stress UspA family protein